MTSLPLDAVLAFLSAADHDTALYDACRAYAARSDGVGDADPETNGELELLRSAIPGRTVVFDVGAQVGRWIDMVLSLDPALQIHAFEPDPRNLAQLEAKRYPATASVTVQAVGLGATAEQRELWTFGDYTEITSLYRRQTLEGYPVAAATSAGMIRLTTLDAYCRSHGVERINYLKIDTEGHDLQVLQGGLDMLAAGKVDVVQFEYGAANIDSRDLLQDFFTFFEALPYALYKIHPKWVAHHARYDQRLENFAYQNWIAVRR
jgi:FkbM family methyltransferase